jgi:ABC-type transport system substrate-binding protein
MNVETPPFDNVEVRRAVAAVIDRDQWIKLKPGVLRATGQLLPPTIEGFRADFPGQTFDPAAARAHMAKAGLAGGWPKPIPYLVVKQDIMELTAQMLAEELAPLGLHLDIRMASYPTFMARTHARGHSAISQQGWQQDYADASDFFEPLFSRAAINDSDSNNTSFFVDDRLETLMTRARREVDPQTRRQLYDEAGLIVADRAPWAFEYNVSRLKVWQPYVRDLRLHASWEYPLATVWLDREEAAGKLALGFAGEERAGFGRRRR